MLGVLLFPIVARYLERQNSRPTNCASNQRTVAAAIQLYLQDNKETFPETSQVWSILRIDPDTTTCPKAKNTPNNFLYNNNLSGINIEKINDPSKIMMTIDGKTTTGLNRKYDNIYYTKSDVLYLSY